MESLTSRRSAVFTVDVDESECLSRYSSSKRDVGSLAKARIRSRWLSGRDAKMLSMSIVSVA